MASANVTKRIKNDDINAKPAPGPIYALAISTELINTKTKKRITFVILLNGMAGLKCVNEMIILISCY